MPFLKKEYNREPRSRRLEKTNHKNGLRHAIFNTVGDKYIGDWNEDEKSGKGILLTRNDELYEGDFERNYRHGYGKLAHKLPNKNIFNLTYKGDWVNGRMHGNGVRIYKDGSSYRGDFRYGKRHGRGQMWYADESFYDGDWVKDARQGAGLQVFSNGNRYEGDWYDDMKHGKGRLYFLDAGLLQIGVWFQDFCTFSVIRNLPFRQTAVKPTVYPLPVTNLIDEEDILREQEDKALRGIGESCLCLNGGTVTSFGSSAYSKLSVN
ncbi:unnamed protein product [Phaedon cochleariae]|uniref:MORN repeat-containing protein 3 n=1 Tax=Phaedon cochleariae TaxID=80249 RepID=A0A9P0DNR8_PHACE|nr:unnamed protein product [Phaedon cochleariae]